jgi:preprotein translocase subunit SecG
MTTLFIILIILASVILGFFVLVQNPKGGGLAGSVGGFSNQFMGVKQTTDVLEKGTWICAAIIAVLCLTSTFFIRNSSRDNSGLENIGTGPVSKPAPANTTTLPGTPAPATK